MRIGFVAFALGGIAAVVLLQSHAQWFWRAALFLPFWAGALGVFQATGQT